MGHATGKQQGAPRGLLVACLVCVQGCVHLHTCGACILLSGEPRAASFQPMANQLVQSRLSIIMVHQAIASTALRPIGAAETGTESAEPTLTTSMCLCLSFM
jgi:hypothetical protein